MLTFTNYLIVILILLVILLGFIYTTDYFEINNLFRQNLQTTDTTDTSETDSEISILPLKNNYDKFLIDNNYATLDSENINNALFINSDEYQITENANNAITNALKNI